MKVLIEMSAGETHYKYEYNFKKRLLEAKRALTSPMPFPVNYGLLFNEVYKKEHIDALVISTRPFAAPSLIDARVIGLLEFYKNGEEDHKVLLLPSAKLDPEFANVSDVTQLSDVLTGKIHHFFSHYRDLDKISIHVDKFLNADAANEYINNFRETKSSKIVELRRG